MIYVKLILEDQFYSIDMWPILWLLVYLFELEGFSGVNYIDDLGGAEVPSLATNAFDCLGNMLSKYNVQESVHKASPPSTRMIFLGILIDTIHMTLEIDEERLLNIFILFAAARLYFVDYWSLLLPFLFLSLPLLFFLIHCFSLILYKNKRRIRFFYQ